MNELSAPALAAWLNDPARPAPLLLDVRETWEFETCHIDDAMLVPMGEVVPRLAEIEQQKQHRPVVCICHHGVRSRQVALFLHQRGYDGLYNLTGGMHAWSLQVDPAVPIY